jgi:hypothetical protein
VLNIWQPGKQPIANDSQMAVAGSLLDGSKLRMSCDPCLPAICVANRAAGGADPTWFALIDALNPRLSIQPE